MPPYSVGMKTRSASAALALAAATCAPLGGQSTVPGQGVEMIMGTRPTATQPQSGVAGIRVIEYVSFDPRRTEHRVVEPLLPAEVLSVQRALIDLGYDPGGLDGQLGPSVRRALRGLQNSRGMDPCGCVDYATVVALGLRSLVVQTVVGAVPKDGSAVEIIMPPALPRPESAPPPRRSAADTVFVTAEASPYWSGTPGLVILTPGLRGGASPPGAGQPTGVGGVPIGGDGPLRLGRPSSTVRTTRPPPRP